MSFLRKYATGSGADVFINIPKAGSARHAVSADWTPSAGEVKVNIDGGATANIATLPVAVAAGSSTIWKFVFSNAELTGKQINVSISKAGVSIDDTGFVIETFGNASAMYPFDLGTATQPVNVTQLLGTAWLTPGTAGTPDVNTKLVGGQTASASGTVTFPNATLASTTNITAGTITTATNVTTVNGLAANVITAASMHADASAEIADAVWDEATAGHVAAGSFGKRDSDTYDFLDTEISQIILLLDSEVVDIKAKTDSLTYTKALELDVNLQSINGTTVNGDGGGVPWGP